MIFQLIVRNVEWYQFVINLIVVIFGRMLDILSTRYVTKQLKLETNRLAQRLGWRGMIFLQMPLIVLGTIDFYFAFFIFIWSLFLFANNIEGSWYIKQVGEDSYQNELKERLKESKKWKILFGELSSLFTFTLTGMLILIFVFLLNDLIAILFIGLAFIFQGILKTFRSIKYLFNLRKERKDIETK